MRIETDAMGYEDFEDIREDLGMDYEKPTLEVIYQDEHEGKHTLICRTDDRIEIRTWTTEEFWSDWNPWGYRTEPEEPDVVYEIEREECEVCAKPSLIERIRGVLP